MALYSATFLKRAGLAACIRQSFWKCVWHFQVNALRKLPARFDMLLLFLHSLGMFIPVRFLPPLALNYFVWFAWFQSVCIQVILMILLFIIIFVHLCIYFLYFYLFLELIFEKYVWLTAHCKLHINTFQFHGILSPSSVEKCLILIFLLLDLKFDLPSK